MNKKSKNFIPSNMKYKQSLFLRSKQRSNKLSKNYFSLNFLVS